MNAPYIIGIGSHSLMCHSIKLEYGFITLNDKIIEDLWQDLGNYNKLSLRSTVQVDLATGFADFMDDQEGPSYAELLMKDVTIINETSGQCYYALHE